MLIKPSSAGLQVELDIELHRNNFYCAKKKTILDFVVARAARIAALIAEAKHEASSLRVMQDTLHSLSRQVQSVNSAVTLRHALSRFLKGR